MQLDVFNSDLETVVDDSSDSWPKVEGESSEASDKTHFPSKPSFLGTSPDEKEEPLDTVESPSKTGATVGSADYKPYINDFSSDGYGALKRPANIKEMRKAFLRRCIHPKGE